MQPCCIRLGRLKLSWARLERAPALTVSEQVVCCRRFSIMQPCCIRLGRLKLSWARLERKVSGLELSIIALNVRS